MGGIKRLMTHEKFLIMKDNIIIKASKDFLDLTEYTEIEFLGKDFIEVNKMLRIDSQIKLQDMDGDHSLYIFTKKGMPIDVTITCKVANKENIKIYYVEEKLQTFLRNTLLNFDDLSIGDKQALAIYSYPGCICLKTNKKYMDNLNSINLNCDDPIGKAYPHQKYIAKVTEEGYFSENQVEFKGSNGIATYWDMSLKLIPGDENETYLMVSLYDVSNVFVRKKYMIKQE